MNTALQNPDGKPACASDPDLHGRVGKLEGQLEGHDNRARRAEKRIATVEDRVSEHSKMLSTHAIKHDAQIATLQEIQRTQLEMQEWLRTWRNVKSTVSVVKATGDGLKWIAVTGAAVGAIWYFILSRHG